jgi:hypothetical protein
VTKKGHDVARETGTNRLAVKNKKGETKSSQSSS